jgi:hypothetical protein
VPCVTRLNQAPRARGLGAGVACLCAQRAGLFSANEKAKVRRSPGLYTDEEGKKNDARGRRGAREPPSLSRARAPFRPRSSTSVACCPPTGTPRSEEETGHRPSPLHGPAIARANARPCAAAAAPAAARRRRRGGRGRGGGGGHGRPGHHVGGRAAGWCVRERGAACRKRGGARAPRARGPKPRPCPLSHQRDTRLTQHTRQQPTHTPHTRPCRPGSRAGRPEGPPRHCRCFGGWRRRWRRWRRARAAHHH